MKKIFGILLALALVLSFAVVATPVSADQYAVLAANITDPAHGDDFMGGDQFTVTANVTNIGNAKAEDVTATIEISGNADLKAVAGNAATKNLAEQLAGTNETVEVSWILVCNGGGDVDIKVTPSGIDGITGGLIADGYLDPDTITIHQKPVLEVTILAPSEGANFTVTSGFTVTATVTNVYSQDATDVELELSYDRYVALKPGETATRVVDDLAASATSGICSWQLECTGDGFSRITVTPSGEVGGTTIPTAALISDTVTIEQGDFDTANITLVEGWNLISLPLIPLSSKIDAVLAGIWDDVNAVWYWDATAEDWDSFRPGGPPGLTDMIDGNAYWINMETARNLTIAGSPMPEGNQLPPAYDVVVGWNMVGFKSTSTTTTFQEYLEGVDPVRIYYYKGSTWHVVSNPGSDKMEPGLGYWMAFTEPGTIYP